jgi:hypothetical protein
MKETRPDPLAAAHRVKDLARDLAQDVADGYRKSTRYFKLRAAVVGSWAVLSLLTLWIACPSGGNALGAEVTVSFEDPARTFVRVSNASSAIWEDVVLTLDGTWRYERKTIRGGEGLVVETGKFTRDGAPAPEALRPRSLEIDCSEGSFETRLDPR